MRVLVAAGGSGGHLFPATAIIKVMLKNPGNQVYLVTSHKGYGRTVMRDLQVPGKILTMRGLPRSLAGKWLPFFRELFQAYRDTREAFKEFRPQIVIGHGGYVTFPALLRAVQEGIPFCLQEQNVVPGMVNRMFLKRAQLVFASSPIFAGKNILDCGNPVRENLWKNEPQPSRQSFGLDPEKTTLLVLGGSQGALRINEVFAQAWQVLEADQNLQVIWSTGEQHFEKIKDKFNGLKRVKVFPFILEIGAAYMASDLVISRAGATTISELNACGRAAILIPYPHATNNHQRRNAAHQVEAQTALLIEEDDLDGEYLSALVRQTLLDREKLSFMAENSLQLGKRKAASYIVAEMNKIISGLEEDYI